MSQQKVTNKFTREDADRLFAYLEEDQIETIELNDFISTLPQRKEIKAIAVLLIEALKEAGLDHLIPTLYFDAPSPHSAHGVFRIPHYNLLTEHWKQCGQCQTLEQDLTELVECMID